MPFGVKSHRDLSQAPDLRFPASVTNAFRREVPSGPMITLRDYQLDLVSPMPFGVKSHRDQARLRDHTRHAEASPMPFGVKSHRDLPLPCLVIDPATGRSPMPFGVKSHRDSACAAMLRLSMESPMPFGVKSHRDGRE